MQPAPANDDSAVPSDFIIRTMTQLLQTQDAADACRLLANCLQQFLGCRQVAVGLCDRRGKRCRLRGLSSVVRFDSHAGYVGALQDAMEEAVVRGCRTAWPPERRFAEARRTGSSAVDCDGRSGVRGERTDTGWPRASRRHHSNHR